MPLSTKQMEYLALAWQCFDTEPKIDYEKFRQLANLASAASARELMRVTKKKLKEEYGAFQANGTSTSTPAATPKSAAKKATPKTNVTPKTNGTGSKRKSHSTTTADDMDDDDETDFLASPTKKVRNSKSATPKIKAEPGVNGVEEDEDGELL